jgi:hypothetical protein
VALMFLIRLYSRLDSFVRHESARLVKFYTLESETNKCVKSASQGYG